MRPFTPLSPRRPAAAALLTALACLAALLATATPAPAESTGEVRAAAAPLPGCTAAEDHTFPLTARLRGGPAVQPAGGGHGTWYLDLTNTTDRVCDGVHPLVVLVDEARALTAAQVRLEYRDGAGTHPVPLETTDRDELIGVLAEGAPGLTVGPGRTLSVELRLALAAGTAPGPVTATAAVVQRRGDDGEWIGQSAPYRFRVTGPAPADESATGRGTGPVAPSVASTPDAEGTGLPFADELAGTGAGRLGAALAVAALLLAAGGAAVLLVRRRH